MSGDKADGFKETTDQLAQPNCIVLCKDQPEEKVIMLKPPQGRNARTKMPKVLSFMRRLEQLQKENVDKDSADQAISFMDFLWAESEFEESILPFALQMESLDDKKYLDEHGAPLEIVNAFMKAAQYLVEKSYEREDVQAAIKKSDNGGQAED